MSVATREASRNSHRVPLAQESIVNRKACILFPKEDAAFSDLVRSRLKGIMAKDGYSVDVPERVTSVQGFSERLEGLSKRIEDAVASSKSQTPSDTEKYKVLFWGAWMPRKNHS